VTPFRSIKTDLCALISSSVKKSSLLRLVH
jgi:hypothetical protein